MIGPDTLTVDLTGRMALPGFHDTHVHPTMGGYALLGCNLEADLSVEAIITKVTACPCGDWHFTSEYRPNFLA